MERSCSPSHHGDTENTEKVEGVVSIKSKEKLYEEELTAAVIGAAIEVHKQLGPGLLESAYEECLSRELELRGIAFERQEPLPLEYKGVKLDCGYRLTCR